MSEDTTPPNVPGRSRSVAARLDDVPADGGLQLTIDGRAVALFVVDGVPVAFDGRCRHRGGPIGDGFVRGGVVTCPLHWWRYDLRTGELVGDPSIRLEPFPTELEDGVVYVTLPAAAPADASVSIRERLLALARAGQPGGAERQDPAAAAGDAGDAEGAGDGGA